LKAATVKQLKDELEMRSPVELMQLTLRLSKFKKENKELLSYLLFEAADEEEYIKEIKVEVDEAFLEINTSRGYFIKKGIRKILKRLKTYIRYSGKKETEAELLIYFCKKMKTFSPSIFKNRVLANTYERQLTMALNAIDKLHEDLQYDYRILIEELD
tara:strand:+ start:2289 stop:2762 length:474 start_codon:yes stop_codon:yes gene_type:complete